MSISLARLPAAFEASNARAVLIGVYGANLYAPSGQAIFPTRNARRQFVVDGVAIPVARLEHILASKAEAGRDKNRLFLAAHRDALEQMLKRQP